MLKLSLSFSARLSVTLCPFENLTRKLYELTASDLIVHHEYLTGIRRFEG